MGAIATVKSSLENFFNRPDSSRLKQRELGDCLQTALSNAAKPMNKLKINPPKSDTIDGDGNYTIKIIHDKNLIVQININMGYPNSEIYVLYTTEFNKPSSETYSAQQFPTVKSKLLEFVSAYK